MYNGRRPRFFVKKWSVASILAIVFSVSVFIVGMSVGFYYLYLDADTSQNITRLGYLPKSESKSVTIDFGFDNVNVCPGDVAHVYWKGFHNIQETSSAVCSSKSLGAPIIGYHGKTYNRTFSKNELAANPGQRRYFKCSSHCGLKSARFEVSCACPCTKEYWPVCCGGKTYSNKCTAECNGCSIFEKGECPCICTQEYMPVCCKNKTYSNKCMAGCEGCSLLVEGKCS